MFFLLQSLVSFAQTKTVIDGDYIVATGQTLVVNENDTLIITGTLELKNNAILTIETNAVCIIYGDLIVKNQVNLSIGAHLIVAGNLTAPSGSSKVVVDVASTAAFYILGTVSDNSGNFNCDNTSIYDPPGDNSCNYGDIISLEDNENDTTGIYDLFVSGDGNKGVTPVYSELCDGESVVISALYQAPGTSYQWCDSIGNPILGETDYQYTASQPGEYFVKITTSVGTIDSYRAKVVVNSLPSIYSAWNNDGGVICAGGAASIGASASSDINWYAGSCSSGILVGTGNRLSVSPDTTTTYFARAFNSTTGCESDNCKSVTVTVNLPPTIVLGTMPVIETEVGNAYIPYSSTTGNPTNYSVDFDADAAIFFDHIDYQLTSDSLVINIPNGGWGVATGTYHGVLTVKTYNPVECESVGYPISVTIVEPSTDASVSIAVSDASICEGEEVTFTATPTNGGSAPGYQWQIDGTDITGANSATFVSTNLVGGQKITCVMTSNLSGVNGSPATSNEITMAVIPIPTATISSSNGPVCVGEDAKFTLTGTDGATVTYSFDGGSTTNDIVLTGGEVTITVNGATSDVTLTLVSISNSGCSTGVSGNETVLVNGFNLVVNDELSGISGSHCPEFLPPFNASSGASYNPGCTEVRFKVLKDLSTTSDFTFDFAIDESGNVEVYDLVSVVAEDNSTINYSGDDAGGSINAGTHTEVTFTFHVVNVPGSQLDVQFSVSNGNDGSCTETGNTTDNSATHVIVEMPVVGDFN